MRAIVLFAHGARDPRWAEPFLKLQAAVQAARDDVDVRLAYLELMSPSLPEVLEELVQKGIDAVTVMPVFLGQGGHVRRDLPALLDALGARFPQVSMTCAPAIGEDPDVLQAMLGACLRALG